MSTKECTNQYHANTRHDTSPDPEGKRELAIEI
jgi:hypothetical protein